MGGSVKSSRSLLRLLALLMALALVAAACGGDDGGDDEGADAGDDAPDASEVEGEPADTNDPFKLYVVGPQTGPNAEIGNAVIGGVKAYFAAHGEEVAGRPVEFEVLDDASTADGAQAQFRRIVSDDESTLVVGHNNGIALSAAVPIIQQANIPYITTTFIDALFDPEPQPWFFSIRGGSADEGAALVAHVENKLGDLDGKRIAVVQLNNGATPEITANAIKELGEEKGYETHIEMADVQLANYDSGAANIAAFGPDAVIIVTTPAVTPVIAKAIINAGVEGPLVGYSAASSTDILEAIGTSQYSADAMVPNATDEVRAAAEEAGEAQYIESTFFSQGWVVASIAARAIAACGADCDRETMIETLESLEPFEPEGGLSYGAIDIRDHTAVTDVQFLTYDEESGEVVDDGDTVTAYGD